MRIPNFFIIGAPKCGTTALHSHLQQHPNIFMSPVKEPHYFCSDLPTMQRFTDEQSYRNLFRGAGDEHVAIGEGSTRYLFSRQAVRRICEFNSAARFIVMLRNPVEMVHSYHSQLVYGFQEDEKDFETAWHLQQARAKGERIPKLARWPENLQYGPINKLGAQVERLLETVSRERVMLILHDDMCRSNQAVYERVLKFLCVPNTYKPSFERVNTNRVWKSPGLGRLLMHTPFPLNLLKNRLKNSFPLRCRAIAKRVYLSLAVPQKRTPPAREMQQQLAEYFRSDICKLEKILQRDLSHWLSVAANDESACEKRIRQAA